MNVITSADMSAHASSFYNHRVITIHTGQFGINFASTLYAGSCDSSHFQPSPILCDFDRESIDEARCKMVSSRISHDMMFAGSGLLGMSNGLYMQFHDQASQANILKEQIFEGIRKQIELMDFAEGFI